jgi:hypothetical protein
MTTKLGKAYERLESARWAFARNRPRAYWQLAAAVEAVGQALADEQGLDADGHEPAALPDGDDELPDEDEPDGPEG